MLLGLETKLDYFSRDLYVMFVKSSACGANEPTKKRRPLKSRRFSFLASGWRIGLRPRAALREIGLDLPDLKGGETEVSSLIPKGTVLRV